MRSPDWCPGVMQSFDGLGVLSHAHGYSHKIRDHLLNGQRYSCVEIFGYVAGVPRLRGWMDVALSG